MSQEEYEKVEGFNAIEAFDKGKKDLPENLAGNHSDDVIEHIYVVFSEDITIESGIRAIEEHVLEGKKLDVRRPDEKGHAVICVVNSGVRRDIENLPEVVRIKVERAANLAVLSNIPKKKHASNLKAEVTDSL